MRTDIVNTEHSEQWLGLDDSNNWQTCGHGGYSEKISRISALEIWQDYATAVRVRRPLAKKSTANQRYAISYWWLIT